MRILAIETSCDETGIAIMEHTGGDGIVLLGNALASQIEIHAVYGGVFPTLAKRAHAEKITVLLQEALDEAELLNAADTPQEDVAERLTFMDEKETTLKEHLVPFLTYYEKPDIDYIAVTVGPGLEPALWVGVNTARALSLAWDIPVIPINHMEGHIVTAALTEVEKSKMYKAEQLQFPLLALLVSGGHSELVIAEAFGAYTKIGQTRDDAVGEAFDKVARMLGLPYPGGPAVSKLAAQWREAEQSNPFTLPRPMLHSGDYDFSFSGIKTAVLYAVQNIGELNDEQKMAMAAEFENAVVEVLVKKTIAAAREYHAPTIIIGGGVASNSYLREQLKAKVEKELPGTTLLFPEPWLATDNAIMIAMAAMLQVISGQIKISAPDELRADGNLSL